VVDQEYFAQVSQLIPLLLIAVFRASTVQSGLHGNNVRMA
jgi:hypothetical protein